MQFTLFILILSIHKRAKYRVIFVRHGETEANVGGQFCGWCNADITAKGRYSGLLIESNSSNFTSTTFIILHWVVGEKEAKRVGITLKKYRYQFDVAYTSFLGRASRTLDIILDELGESTIEKYETWRFNERHTGALTGKNKDQALRELGEKQVYLLDETSRESITRY